MTAIQSGTLTFAASLGAVAIRMISAKVLRRFGFSRVLIGNSFICSAWIASFTPFTPSTPHWAMLLVIAGFGMVRGTQFNACQTLSCAEMPPGQTQSGNKPRQRGAAIVDGVRCVVQRRNAGRAPATRHGADSSGFPPRRPARRAPAFNRSPRFPRATA